MAIYSLQYNTHCRSKAWYSIKFKFDVLLMYFFFIVLDYVGLFTKLGFIQGNKVMENYNFGLEDL